MIKAIFFTGFISLFLLGTVAAQKAKEHQKPDHFAGIGISIEIDSTVHLPIIVEVLSGKPGAMAGLRSGDYLLAIGHWKTYHKSKDKAIRRLRGKAGTTIELTIRRLGKELKFNIKRQPVIIANEPANLCEALDSLMKSGPDTFANIKGKMLNDTIMRNQIPDYEWESTLKIPKFSRATIVKKYDMDAYYKGVFFEGKDSIQAINRFDRLVSDVRDCLPYTCSVSYQESNSALINSFYSVFYISQVKSFASPLITGSVITVKYQHLPGHVPQVLLIYTINKNGALQLNR